MARADMTPTRSLLPLLHALIACAWLPIQAQAEAPKPDAAVQQVLRKAQGALRQLAQEKSQLEADNAALQKDKATLQEQVAKLEATVKQLEPLQGEVEKQKAALAALQTEKAGLEGQITQSREREQGLHGKIKDIVTKAKAIQGDNLLLVQAVKEREEWIGQCQQKNAAIVQTGEDLVQRYQDKGFWDELGDVEPLTGIGKVNTENVAQDYHFKLQDLKATPFESKDPQGEAAASAPAKAVSPDEEDEAD